MALTDNLVAYWKLDESSGNAVDATGGGNTLTPSNGTYTTGKIGNGLSFSGASNSYGTFATKLGTLWDNPYTLSMWIYTTAHDTTNGDILLWPGDRNQQHIYANSSEGNNLAISTYDGVPVNIKSATSLSTGQWYFVVFQRTGGTTGKIYLNGADDTASGGSMRNPAGTLTQDFRLGSRQDYTVANANILFDEVGIWSRALSGAEITSLYNNGAGLAYPFSSSGTNIKINVGDTWKTVSGAKINIGDTWKTVSGAKVNIGDTWKTIF